MRSTQTPHDDSQGREVGTVFTGGPILTMDSDHEVAEAVAVRDGRIVAVGSAEDVRSFAGADAETVDLDGRTLLPGLIDPHMHSALVQLADWVDVSPMSTPNADAVYAALRDAEPTSTGWVLAQQFDPSITAGDPRLDRAMLDRLVPDRPALVLESNGHVAYANSLAFERAGVDQHTPDPPAGRYIRDARGELTGRLEEASAVAAFTVGFPMVAGDALVDRIEQLLWRAASTGATLLHDCGIGSISGAADLDALQKALGSGSPVRYRGMLVSSAYDTWSAMGLKPGFGDALFRVHGIKAWSDGSNQGGSGYQRKPYLGTESRGMLNYSSDQLAEIVHRAHADGWQVGVHANGDAAIDVTIDAFEHALALSARGDHRHRIEHCSILHPEQIDRMASLGLSPSFLIGHIRWWGGAFRDRLLGPERADLYDPCASALRAGLRISLHSDWNVTPLEPLRYVEDAVTRIMAENGEVLNLDERIPVAAALRAVTIDAAWQCRSDDITGSISVGKFADFALLEDNPLTVDPTTISKIVVSETRLAGEVRFSR
ncbi:Exoenzymes regulatory protein AepA precursor [Microbacterium esteraromaticum]|uniref:Exoenzymes regulatory protein AepA n=1 Tax=Microbacterium esteraromaticum TaxID=57043 RepID=A0A1R4IDL9_9MICO|nr:amidohydrolase [Microbacterium esteraromaticum]SJN17383.1 Exoenzymes regulatory protein AepA precursor [Microbacterium esteraromaticum]